MDPAIEERALAVFHPYLADALTLNSKVCENGAIPCSGSITALMILLQ